jgi:hypothetical protein
MKKYRLIKEYPGSPKIGDIVKGSGRDGWYSKEEGHSTYDWTHIVLHPEYWKEVIGKDYEILEYRTKSGLRCRAPFLQNSHQFYTSEGCNIHSVKRLSDGEVFTIGDIIGCIPVNKHLKSQKFTKVYQKIDIIAIIDNEVLFQKDNRTWIESTSMKNAEHKKRPLFTTEDGVDIFEGDTVYYIETEEEPELCFIVNKYTVLKHSGRFTSDNSLHSFSTKEKAEEYILMNKPCLSYKEASDIMLHRDISAHYKKIIREKLKELVKQKLNK